MFRLFVVTMIAVLGVQAPPQEPKQEATRPTSQPVTSPAVQTKPSRPTQARIYEELLQDVERPRANPILSREPGKEGDTTTSKVAVDGLLLEGTTLFERAGRLVRLEGRSEFQFTSGNAKAGGPQAMEILKSGLLEQMEDESDLGVKEFVITAEVMRYRGRNLILLHKYRRQINNGNVSP